MGKAGGGALISGDLTSFFSISPSVVFPASIKNDLCNTRHKEIARSHLS
jgi:hypothetical protein